jgi:hypothetical protein
VQYVQFYLDNKMIMFFCLFDRACGNHHDYREIIMNNIVDLLTSVFDVAFFDKC